MARIALRAYNREIEHLIEGGQIEEAIAHCRHIFKYFPKHINTYRLLGKAYLETQRYGDAADILQRVLSSIPDDFISHLGMSIIREDEGNLDEAIWHMERAFEVQPANRAIQDELRRLYGRRDGLEPPKIRLTRGALARMYAKGDLYPQAVAELRAALAEDSQRLDLQVVLADVHGRAGQRVEAASICNGLLRKLPYCLVANQVMADILADSERSEDARVYRQRAQALDAYLAHTSPGAPTPDKVPDIAVSLERLDWQPGKSIEGSSQPDWAASLGVELESGPSQKEEIPDWLSAVQSDADQAVQAGTGESSSPFTDISDTAAAWADETGAEEIGDWSSGQAPDAAQLSSEAEIPDWMKAAGWSPSSGEAGEEASGFEFDEEDFSTTQPEGELEEANLPDWLKEIAPENLDQISSKRFDEPDWGKPSDEDATILQDTPDWFKETDDEAVEEEESADWLAGLAGAAVAGAVVGEAEEISGEASEDLPDWLKEMDADEEASPTSETRSPEISEVESVDEIPDWLKEMEAGKTDISEPEFEAELEGVEDLPDWLQEMEAGKTDISEPEFEAELERIEDLPDWLQEMAIEGEEEPVPEQSMDLPDWMVEKEPEAGDTSPLEAIADETAGSEEAPDWLQEVPAGDLESESGTAKIEIDEEAIPTEELQSWLIESEDESAGEKMAAYPAEPVEEIPDWLIEMQTESAADDLQDQLPDIEAELDAEIEPATEAEAEALFDEGMTVITPLEQMEDAVVAEVPELLEQDEVIEPEEQVAFPSSGLEESSQLDSMDADSAFAWLESLAVKQGADEALLLSPEERSETPPEWVQAAVESELEAVEQTEAMSEAAIEETPEMETLAVDHQLESQAEELETADVLSEASIAEISEFETTEQEISTDQEEFEPSVTIPDWLQEAGEVIETVDEEEAIPDWFQETEETVQDEIEESEEPAQPAEEIPDWLKSMKLEQDESEQAELPTAEELPDWLQELPEEAEEQETLAEPQEDWFTSLEEPVIEGDTKPTRLGLESQKEETHLPEDSPTIVSLVSETETEFEPSTSIEIEELQQEDLPEQPAEEPGFDADADFAWLESLAVKQGADEALLLEPDERLEGPPEWIQAALDKQFGDEQTRESVDELAESAEQIAIDAQESITEEVLESTEKAAETPDLPDWLRDMEAEAGQEEAIGAIDALTESTAMIEQEEIPELPSWLAEPEDKEEAAWTPAEPAFQKIDLNQASLAELERLPGIGFIMAQKIIIYREQNGPFTNPMDLQLIPGFSPTMLQDIEDRILVETVEEEPLRLPVEAGTPPELADARRAMLAGSLEEALEKYGDLVFNKKSLDEVIYDLNQILLRHGDDAAVWQTLGDAQMRANLVQDALEAYTRAEQLFQ